MKELPIIIKADVQGSAEVLADTLAKLVGRQGQDPDHPLRASARSTSRTCCSRRRRTRSSSPSTCGRIGTPRRSPNREARRHPAALGHLQRHRRDEEGDDGPARADVQGSPHRRRRSAQHLQGAEVRHDRRLHGHRRPHHARRAIPRRGCCATTSSIYEGKIGSLRRFKDDVSEVKAGLRVRHRLRPVQRHQGRRHHRSVHDGARRHAASIDGYAAFRSA